MNVDFVDIKNYLANKEENIYIRGYCYSIIVSVLLILVILISSYYKKNVYYKNVLLVENGGIFLIVNFEELGLIKKNNRIIINDSVYSYDVLNTDMVNNDKSSYQIEIVIHNSSFKENNQVCEYKILLREESILKYLVRVMKGV